MNNQSRTYIIGGVILIVIIAVIIGVTRNKGASTDTGAKTPNQSLEEQAKKSKELSALLNSERNDFSKGNYSLSSSKSSITWTYGKLSGTIPVTDGALNVLDGGRIEKFDTTLGLKDIVVTSAGAPVNVIDDIKGKNLLNTGEFPTGKIVASSVLPNSVDDAFTISFQVEAGGKKASFASGVYVTHEGDGIKVAGEVYLDPKNSGYPTATDSLKLKLNYIFEK